MTAHELARQLLAMPDIDVKFAYNYGDHWRTTVAEDVEKVRVKEVVYSNYHTMDKIADDDDRDMHGDAADFRQAVVLF